MDDLKEKKRRLDKAIAFLISIGEIGSDTPTKNIAMRMNRDYSGVCSAINGSERYLTRKFAQAFCADFGSIISFDWLWNGKGKMTEEEKSDSRPEEPEAGADKETQKERLRILKDWLVRNDDTCRNSELRVLKMMGLGEGYFSNKEKGTGSIHSNTYVKIKKAWPYVNLDWIMTGDGKMLDSKPQRDVPSGEGVPYYDVDFLGGFDEMLNDQTDIPTYSVDFKPYNAKGNMWVNITGESMSPRINSGDKICIRKILPDDIIYGEIYAIVTQGGLRTVKWVTRAAAPGLIRLIPENKDPRFGDYQDIELKDILYIYKVVGAIRSF